jgi:hypothetical protein
MNKKYSFSDLNKTNPKEYRRLYRIANSLNTIKEPKKEEYLSKEDLNYINENLLNKHICLCKICLSKIE